MSRSTADRLLVTGILFGVSGLVLNVLAFANRESPAGPGDPIWAIACVAVALVFVVLGMILKHNGSAGR